MPCPNIAELEKFAAGICDDDTFANIQSHIATCHVCDEQLSDISDNIQFMNRLQLGRTRQDDGSIDADDLVEPMPETIGSYRLVREIGRGGMGVVYEAMQREPSRPVALKLLNVAYARDAYYAKLFERETRALARLDHAGIASIYEAGRAPGGRAFFAMELVHGEPITTYAKSNELDHTARLRLFCHVCDAIAFAHQRGVIHRDLKPSNVLIRKDGAPTVLDFGLAKIVEDPDERSLVTQVGRVFGTLPYMSPEQARGDSESVDTRSDVYSMGVVLYQLLTDRLPYEINSMNIAASVRAICDEPPRRLSVMNPQYRGDLETVVLKALEKDPDRRYQTASALRNDIERFLNNEPILARAPSTVYQLRKLAARNKPLVGALAALLIVLLAGAIVATWQAVRAIRAEQLAVTRQAEAESETAKFKAINEFLQDMLSSVSPEKSPGQLNLTVRDVLDGTVTELNNGALRSQPEIEAAVRTTLGNTYRALGDFEAAEPQLRQAVSIGRQFYTDGHADLAFSIHKLARLLDETGQFEEAESLLCESLEMRLDLYGPVHEDVAKSRNNLGVLLWQRGRLDEAEAFLREALAVNRQVHGSWHVEVATTMNNVALVLHQRRTPKSLEEAASLLKQSLDMDKALRGEDHPNITTTMSNLAVVLADLGHTDQAEKMLRDVVGLQRRLRGAEHPQIAVALSNLAWELKRQQRYEEAAALFLDALSMHRKTLGDNHPSVARTATNLAKLYTDTNQHIEAEPLYREALAVYQQKFGDADIRTVRTLYFLGKTLVSLEKLDDAEALIDQGIASARAVSPPDEKRLAVFQTVYGQCLIQRDRLNEAEQILAESIDTLVRTFGDEHGFTREAREALATLNKHLAEKR